MKPHHLHAGLAKSGVSVDLGPTVRARLEGATRDDTKAIAMRIAVLWNMHEGIPTSVLEAGAVRAFYDAAAALLASIRAAEPTLFDAEIHARAADVETAWSAVTLELTADGRRAECACSERVERERKPAAGQRA